MRKLTKAEREARSHELARLQREIARVKGTRTTWIVLDLKTGEVLPPPDLCVVK